jgi:hypothetical protein
LRVVSCEHEHDSFRFGGADFSHDFAGAEADREPHQLRWWLRARVSATATSAAIIATSTAASTPTLIFGAASIIFSTVRCPCVKLLSVVILPCARMFALHHNVRE